MFLARIKILLIKVICILAQLVVSGTEGLSINEDK